MAAKAKKEAEQPQQPKEFGKGRHEELGITYKKKADFGKWYLEVIAKSDIVDERVPIKGVNVILPNGWRIWHSMMERLDDMLQEAGVENYTFPLFIPERMLKAEAAHFKGFVPEVAWVTHVGDEKLEEKLAIRPTSETIMYEMFRLWIRSWKDLPKKVNQYVNIVRWDTKMTKPLIRDREFQWHETHTAYATKEEAEADIMLSLNIYSRLIRGTLGLEYLELKRPDWDKFPGAEYSVALDALMPDGKSLQIGTTHFLGQKFSKMMDIKFLDQQGKHQMPWQNSYGITTRLLGALIAIHGDDKGLIIPPAIAPIQAVIVPIYTAGEKLEVMKKCSEVLGKLEIGDWRVHMDDRESHSPGFKFHEWEMLGVPIRIEIGPRDVHEGKVSMVRRDFLERVSVPEDSIEQQLKETADSMFFQLTKRAAEGLIVRDASDWKELKTELDNGGFVRIPFCGSEKDGKKVKDELKADVKGTLFSAKEKPEPKARCAVCGSAAKELAYIARSY
jgi:prolyl-tRNA synthetase